MGRALLSALVHDLYELTSQLNSSDAAMHVDQLTTQLQILDGLVDDAETKQFTRGSEAQQVKDWLNALQYAFYRSEQLLLCITTTTMTFSRRGNQFLRVLLRTKKKKAEKLKILDDAVEELEALAEKKDPLGLTAVNPPPESLQGLLLAPSSAVLDNYFSGKYPKDCFYGRREEEQSLVETLLSDTQRFKVINIAGKAGVGKTAFVDAVYLNHKLRESFELRAWVTVPYKATVNTMARKIFEAVANDKEQPVPGEDLDALTTRLQERLADGKKFLLVLDGIEIEDEDGKNEWSMLIDSFISAAARGSAVILTSIHEYDPLPAGHTVHLGPLSAGDCWSIFFAHASGCRRVELDERPDLVAVGKEIVNKLGSLPLAAKMIGSLLQDKDSLHQWVDILRSELLDANNADLPFPSFLALCYLDLPARVKQCFAYLSLFPKAYQFKRNEVVLLWMAQGFLKITHSESNGNKSMEDVGDEYFGYLVMRSFLQPHGSGVCFTMHNLVHDLATYVFGETQQHHLSYSETSEDSPEPSLGRHGETLRTVLPYVPFNQATEYFNLKLAIKMWNPEVLRVLSLSRYYMTDLPASIGRLSHLCYLDLSYTGLHKLPDSICYLLNLQTLKLTGCTSLSSFPKKFCKLVNLRHLDLKGVHAQEMPSKMHKLTSLRTLTNFIVSKNRPGLGDLAPLSNLKTITISKLQNVAQAKYAADAKLKEKNSLDGLVLQWGNGKDSIGNEIVVLENLEPHKDLKGLLVQNYSGSRFPRWLGDPSFQALRVVALRHCENCTSLPTLGLLPFLRDLFIEGFTKVSSIGLEFYGEMTASQKPFQSLEFLQFRDMLQWEEWNIVKGIEFPHLINLCIIRCPKLVGDLPKQLVSLKKLEIIGCTDLVATLPKVPDTCKVFVQESNEILMKRSHSQEHMGRGTVSEQVHEITSLSDYGFPGTSTVSDIQEIPHESWEETESLGRKFLLDSSSSDTTRTPKPNETSSGMLSYHVEADFSNIEEKTDPQSSIAKANIPITTQAAAIPITVETLSEEDLDDQRSSIEVLNVSNISELKSLPSKLHILKFEGCEFLEALPDDLLGGITTLKELYLINCSSLRSFPYPGSLATLYMCNCRRLEFLTSLESRKKLAYIQHLLIGSCDSLTTFALNLFSQLKILSIWDCTNLVSFYVTKEFGADLASLESLEIRDCPRLKSFPDEVLHAPNLASVFISNCKNLNKLPAMNSLTSLKTLFLHKCPEVESFPFGGLPSSLSLLSIAYCDKLTPQKSWRLDTLESLNRLELEGGCIDMDSFPEDKLLPPNINSIRISTLKSLKKLDYRGFQHLNALHTLEIHCCDMLGSLPNEGLPSSLNQLCVEECSLLTPRLKPKRGKEWHKVARIPHIQIDHQIIED